VAYAARGAEKFVAPNSAAAINLVFISLLLAPLGVAYAFK
jgi:hypothetical protein